MLDLSGLTSREAVTAIFIGYYDRAPAPNGLNYWSEEIDMGATLADTARAFSVVTESQTLYPALGTSGSTTLQGNVDFVTAVFMNLFGRAPNNLEGDGSGNFWVAQLEGGADIGQLILDIMSGAQGADLEILTNKIEVGINYATAAEAAGELSRDPAGDTILDGVTAADTSVAAAQALIDAAFPAPAPTPTPGNTINLNPDAVVVSGTDGADVFAAESGDLTSSITINGGAGTDALTVISETVGVALTPRTESIEQIYFTNQVNDRGNASDNNVFNDVEIDAGRMEGVNRWENYDSRADLIIEDARDGNPDDGTFTAALTVAMVSTDPGNVDYAVYFDNPINTSTSSGTLTVQILDLDSAAAGNGPLDNNPYDLVSFRIDGELFELEVADLDAANVSYAAYVAALQASANAQSIPVTISLGQQFTLIQANGSAEVGTEINITVENAEISEGGFNANDGLPANNNTVTRQTPLNLDSQQKITLNVEFDDVGKGSTGGDALFGAMSTGRQDGDMTSNSTGIERFEVLVDRSSNLQTLNSTNDTLEEVAIRNGENSGLNNTTGAADNAAGSLTIRGDADARGNSGTDTSLTGAAPQDNNFGLSDVRTIEAASMNGALDITAELTDGIVGKYLDIQDGQSNGENDDVDFIYALGNGNDEFLLNISSDALLVAGTGSREDFDLSITGGAGADVITTNVGRDAGQPGADGANKFIDGLGEDYYRLTSDNAENWYVNAVSNVAAEMSVNGGAGADVIWTHGWGDFTINDGSGNDAVYTDNSAARELLDLNGNAGNVFNNLGRSLTEHEQIDYVVGSAWAFNAEGTLGAGLSGATNENIVLATLPANSPLLSATTGSINVLLSYDGASGANTNDYNVVVTIPFSEITINAARQVSITEQALNQAIKNGVNNENGVLSKVLEATDGPGNSLIVATKVDGVHQLDDFTVSLGGTMQLNGTAVNVTGVLGADYTAPQFASGANSLQESDNTINVGTGNDVFVLSTNDGNGFTFTANTTLDAATDLNGASNERLNFDDGFGTDTVFNFDAGGNDGIVDNADDVMDFTGITGVGANFLIGGPGGAATTLETTNATLTGSVDIVAAATIVDVNSSGTIDAADFAALYQGDAVASNHIIIVWDTTGDNGGEVWSITDGAAATGDVNATNQGTINLVGTDWSAIGNDNIA